MGGGVQGLGWCLCQLKALGGGGGGMEQKSNPSSLPEEKRKTQGVTNGVF